VELKPVRANPFLGVDHLLANTRRPLVKARPGVSSSNGDGAGSGSSGKSGGVGKGGSTNLESNDGFSSGERATIPTSSAGAEDASPG
jgi:hypothetical protein